MVPSTTGAGSAYGNLPLAFEANRGQAAAPVDFLSHNGDATLSLSAGNLKIASSSGAEALTVRLVGANPAPAVTGLDPLITKTNYLTGNDASQWKTNIPNFGKVMYQNVYPGISLDYYGNQGHLEYDFLVNPGANPDLIDLAIHGAHGIALDSQGNLVMHTAGGDVTEQAPVLYQQVGGARQAVTGSYVLHGNRVGFHVGAYDPTRPLVIDPVLSYSTYFPVVGVYAIAVDSSDNAYLTGQFGNFVAKLNATGTALDYITYLGSSGSGSGIAVDGLGDAYVTGYCNSADFPTTANAFSTTGTGFLTEVNPAGTGLIYSTLLPGVNGASNNYGDWKVPHVALDSSGNAYVTGNAGAGFVTTGSAFQPNLGSSGSNTFLAKINPSLSGTASLVYSTYLGGNGTDQGTGVAVDSSGNAYVTGYTSSTNFPTTVGALQTTFQGSYDAFVAKFNPSLSGSASLIYCTYLGGNGAEFQGGTLQGSGGNLIFFVSSPAIAVDSSGDAFVAGRTTSTNFPTTPGAYETSVSSNSGLAFISKLNPTGSALVYSTYLGQPGSVTGATCIALDAAGNAYVAGLTYSSTFPTVNPIQSQLNGVSNAFVTTLNSTGSQLLFSTYLGGNHGTDALGIAVDAAGNIFVAGRSGSTNFPTTTGAFQPTWGNSTQYEFGEGFVSEISKSPDFAVTGFPATPTAGVAGTFTVTAQNADGSTNTGYTGMAHFTSSDPQAVLPADYSFTAADQGVHTFSATLRTAGSQSITTTDTGNPSITGGQGSILVQAAAATHFVLSGPTSIAAGKAFSITVTAVDAYGNVATGYTGTIHFTDSVNGATLPADYTFKGSDNGVHTFSGVKLKTKGWQTITVTDTLVNSIVGSWTIDVV